jgi:hypothetical protein
MHTVKAHGWIQTPDSEGHTSSAETQNLVSAAKLIAQLPRIFQRLYMYKLYMPQGGVWSTSLTGTLSLAFEPNCWPAQCVSMHPTQSHAAPNVTPLESHLCIKAKLRHNLHHICILTKLGSNHATTVSTTCGHITPCSHNKPRQVPTPCNISHNCSMNCAAAAWLYTAPARSCHHSPSMTSITRSGRRASR